MKYYFYQEEFKNMNLMDKIPVGFYSFELPLDCEMKHCQVLVYEKNREAYEKLMRHVKLALNEQGTGEVQQGCYDFEACARKLTEQFFHDKHLRSGHHNENMRQMAAYMLMRGRTPRFVKYSSQEMCENALLYLENLKKQGVPEDKLYEMKGRILMVMRRHKEAMDVFKQVLKLDGKNLKALAGAAEIHCRAGKWHKAEKYLSGADEIQQQGGNPKQQGRITMNLALARWTMGKKEQAVQLMRRAVQCNPGHELAPLFLGRMLKDMGNTQEAFEIFNSILEKNPDFAYVHFCIGEMLFEKKEYSQARNALEKCLQLDDTIEEACYYLGFIYLEEGKLSEALKHFEGALRYDANDVSSLSLKGYILEMMSRHGAALKCYQKVLQLNPKDKLTRENIQRVEKCMRDIG